MYLRVAVKNGWRGPTSIAACIIPGILVVLFGYRTHARNMDWQDELVFWKATLASSPLSARAHHHYGRLLMKYGHQTDKAREHFEIAARSSAADFLIFRDLQRVYLETAQREEQIGNHVAAKSYLDKARASLARATQLQQEIKERLRRATQKLERDR